MTDLSAAVAGNLDGGISQASCCRLNEDGLLSIQSAQSQNLMWRLYLAFGKVTKSDEPVNCRAED